jgi:hypothetical protein
MNNININRSNEMFDRSPVYFSDRNSVYGYVCDHSTSTDVTCYEMSYDDLMEHATDNFIDYLNERGFIYGKTNIEDIEISDETWWSFFE